MAEEVGGEGRDSALHLKRVIPEDFKRKQISSVEIENEPIAKKVKMDRENPSHVVIEDTKQVLEKTTDEMAMEVSSEKRVQSFESSVHASEKVAKNCEAEISAESENLTTDERSEGYEKTYGSIVKSCRDAAEAIENAVKVMKKNLAKVGVLPLEKESIRDNAVTCVEENTASESSKLVNEEAAKNDAKIVDEKSAYDDGRPTDKKDNSQPTHKVASDNSKIMGELTIRECAKAVEEENTSDNAKSVEGADKTKSVECTTNKKSVNEESTGKKAGSAEEESTGKKAGSAEEESTGKKAGSADEESTGNKTKSVDEDTNGKVESMAVEAASKDSNSMCVEAVGDDSERMNLACTSDNFQRINLEPASDDSQPTTVEAVRDNSKPANEKTDHDNVNAVCEKTAGNAKLVSETASDGAKLEEEVDRAEPKEGKEENTTEVTVPSKS